MLFRFARRWSLVAVLALALGASGTARADLFLTLNSTGDFNATTTLGGIAFGADTAFSYQATFDASTPAYTNASNVFYEATAFIITISGHGTYTVNTPDINLNVFLFQLSSNGINRAGLLSAGGSTGYTDFYSGSSAPFNPVAPTPTVLTGYTGYSYALPYTISLAGVSGGLVINGFGAATHTAALTVPVPTPEPSTLVAAGMGVLLVVGHSWRRRRSA